MNCPHEYQEERSERGAALLIAIFALLLISVVGIALIVSTGTDSALTGNYRTSASAYYAAVAGLEEARGRLLWKNPNYINRRMPHLAEFSGSSRLGTDTGAVHRESGRRAKPRTPSCPTIPIPSTTELAGRS